MRNSRIQKRRFKKKKTCHLIPSIKLLLVMTLSSKKLISNNLKNLKNELLVPLKVLITITNFSTSAKQIDKLLKKIKNPSKLIIHINLKNIQLYRIFCRKKIQLRVLYNLMQITQQLGIIKVTEVVLTRVSQQF